MRTFWVPNQPICQCSYYVVGSLMSPRSGWFTMERLAARGYVCLHPSHAPGQMHQPWSVWELKTLSPWFCCIFTRLSRPTHFLCQVFLGAWWNRWDWGQQNLLYFIYFSMEFSTTELSRLSRAQSTCAEPWRDHPTSKPADAWIWASPASVSFVSCTQRAVLWWYGRCTISDISVA